MQTLLMAIWLLADGDEQPPPDGGIFGINPFILMAIMFFFYFIVMRPNTQDRRRRAMLDSLKKNDRVLTSAGIKGTVANINREQNEAVLTIDKSTKAQMTVTLDAIGHVIVDEKKKVEADKS